MKVSGYLWQDVVSRADFGPLEWLFEMGGTFRYARALVYKQAIQTEEIIISPPKSSRIRRNVVSSLDPRSYYGHIAIELEWKLVLRMEPGP